MIFTTSDGKAVYYDIQGNQTATNTLVFLNGLTQSTEAWGLVVPYFKDQYRIVVLDFVFQGRSSNEGEWRDFDQHASDVEGVLKEAGIGKVILVGISYGSLVAQHYALIYPERLKAMILISTFAHKTPYYDAIELSWWRALEIGGYQLMLDIMLPTVLSEHYFSNPLIPIQMMKESRKDINQSSQAIFHLMKATRERKDFRESLKGVRCKTLVVQGEKDFLLPVHLAEEVQKNIPDAILKVIPNAGHTLNLEYIAELVAIMRPFLNEIK
jgi:pimeloyl-ACP methyl ester carboxylesterase